MEGLVKEGCSDCGRKSYMEKLYVEEGEEFVITLSFSDLSHVWKRTVDRQQQLSKLCAGSYNLKNKAI